MFGCLPIYYLGSDNSVGIKSYLAFSMPSSNILNLKKNVHWTLKFY